MGRGTETMWEYRVESLDFQRDPEDALKGVQSRLNELGGQGWELVSLARSRRRRGGSTRS
jgi:Domain of unknown function (DUF4177)